MLLPWLVAGNMERSHLICAAVRDDQFSLRDSFPSQVVSAVVFFAKTSPLPSRQFLVRCSSLLVRVRKPVVSIPCIFLNFLSLSNSGACFRGVAFESRPCCLHKMGIRVGIWNLKDIPNNIHPPWLHDVLCLWRNIQKELVQSSLSNFKLSTEHYLNQCWCIIND